MTTQSTEFASKITSISHQPPAGSANAQFEKTQFFLDTLDDFSTSSAKYVQEDMSITPSLYIRTTLTFYPNFPIGSTTFETAPYIQGGFFNWSARFSVPK